MKRLKITDHQISDNSDKDFPKADSNRSFGYQQFKQNIKLTLKGIAYIAIALMGGVYFVESAYATFDLDKGIKAATDPLITLITKYYGVAIGLGASAGALVGQGDLRTKAINAGIGAAVSGGVVLALLKAVA